MPASASSVVCPVRSMTCGRTSASIRLRTSRRRGGVAAAADHHAGRLALAYELRGHARDVRQQPALRRSVGGAWREHEQRPRRVPAAIDQLRACSRGHRVGHRQDGLQRSTLEAKGARQMLIVGALVQAAPGTRHGARQQCARMSEAYPHRAGMAARLSEPRGGKGIRKQDRRLGARLLQTRGIGAKRVAIPHSGRSTAARSGRPRTERGERGRQPRGARRQRAGRTEIGAGCRKWQEAP